MKIKLSLSELNSALDRVSVVKPMLGSNKNSAFLFTVKDDRCYIHSNNADNLVARVEVPVISCEEGASFAYPADRVAALKSLDGWIEIESGEGDEGSWIKYTTEGGASADRTTYSVKAFNAVDRKLDSITKTTIFSTALLKDGLSTASAPIEAVSAAADSEESHNQTVQLFDASREEWKKGDGTFFGTCEGNRSYHFYSPSLAGKGFSVHIGRLSTLLSFLGKCGKKVKIAVGDGMTFAIDQWTNSEGELQDGAVFGWTHHAKVHERYRYLGSKQDKLVLLTPKELILKALRQVRLEMQDSKRDKVRMVYSNDTVRFLGGVNKESVKSVEVPVRNIGEAFTGDFTANANVGYLMDLFSATRVNEVELRIAVSDAGKKAFRTVEKFYLNDSGKMEISPETSKEETHECLVTRFMMAMD